MKHVLFSLMILFTLSTYGETHTISGYVTDLSNGESLIGVNVFATGTRKGVVTNN